VGTNSVTPAGYRVQAHTLAGVRVLLVSTYELGRQPVHLASPAAALRANEIDVVSLDLAVEEWSPSLLDTVDAVAFSVPMHTAMRLATSLALAVRGQRPDLPIAFYGLYAGAGPDDGGPADIHLIGEYEPGLVAWARGLSRGERHSHHAIHHLGRSTFLAPDRSGLPGHERYAHLEWNGESRLAAAVEASHGCRHRCRHCPIPAVYDGRMRVVGTDAVLADIDQLARDGVEHITFGDPDFLNAPRYSLDLLREAHAAHSDLTFDVTAKVEHIVEHGALWSELASLGVLFVVSAFESTDYRTLQIFDKGHTPAEMATAVGVVRAAGIHIRPTWLPFSPWTSPGHLADLVRFLDEHRLWSATDPVQLAIKLLIPRGSLLEAHPEVLPRLIEYDVSALSWSWEFDDPAVGILRAELDRIAAEGSGCGAEIGETLAAMRERIGDLTGAGYDPIPASPPAPRLTESWFCCAEPTATQATAVGLTIGRVAATST
jgi:hypothetical protein